MLREPSDIKGWLKATERDLSRAIRVEASDADGFCACVTCGDRHHWRSGKMHAGHFIGKPASIKFAEIGIHPQCRDCNTTGRSWSAHITRQKLENVSQSYLEYMLERYGPRAVEALRRLKNESKKWTVEELRVMRVWYKSRFDAAIKEKGL